MFNHITINTNRYEEMKECYVNILRHLNYSLLFEEDHYCGFGLKRPEFWLSRAGDGFPASAHLHIAFDAQTRSAVNCFYQAGLKAGGTDNGAPGLRAEYHADYYAAFIKDLDGHNIEAVTFSKN